MKYITIILLSLTFLLGFKTAKNYGLDQCKNAGWDFIEEVVFPKEAVKKSLWGEKYALEQLKRLQANIATKCIERF